MKGIRGTKRSLHQRQQKLLGASVDLLRELDTHEHARLERIDDGAVDAAGCVPRQRALTQPARHCRDQLRDSQVGDEQVGAPLQGSVELVASELAEVQLEKRTRVAVQRPG